MKIQITWINTLKFIGILSVILGHIASPFGYFIFSWHMPLFFMIAGFFIKFEGSIKDFIIKDVKKLMIPYIIFAFLGLFLEIFKRFLLHWDSLNILTELKGIFWAMDYNGLVHHYGFVLWFLPALVVARIVLFSLHKIFQNIKYQTIYLSIIVAILFILSFYLELPFGIDNGLNCLLWVFFGNILYKNIENPYLKITPLVFIGLLLFLPIPLLDISTKTYGNISINIIRAFSFVTTLIFFLKSIYAYSGLPGFLKKGISSPIITRWGTNTMILFILHPYTNNIAYLLEFIRPGLWYGKLLISIVLLYVVLIILRKFKHIHFVQLFYI